MTHIYKQIFIPFIIFVLVIAGSIMYYRHMEHFPSTDDAYVRANIDAISSPMPGKVAHVHVSNNQKVTKDQKLFSIEPLQPSDKEIEVKAPATGIVSNLSLRPGNIVNAGQPLFSLIETSHFWVDANFQETQLTHIKTGLPATIKVDMYPDKKFDGVVESISHGSTNTFSLFPAENASGNWVKVTQRFTVRVKILKLDPEYPLRVGASCNVMIDTTQKPAEHKDTDHKEISKSK